MNIEFDAYKQKLNEVRPGLEALADSLNIEGLRNELERLAVDHVLLAATVRVARLDPKHPLNAQFYAYMKQHFPNWQRNPYLDRLPALHKLLLKLIGKKQYGLIRLLFQIKDRT